MSARTLVENAQKGRSLDALGELIGVSGPMLSMIQTGKRPCPPWLAARLAEEAGGEPMRTALAHLVATTKGPEKALWQRLSDSLAKALTIVAMAGALSFQAPKIRAADITVGSNNLYIMRVSATVPERTGTKCRNLTATSGKPLYPLLIQIHSGRSEACQT